MRHPPVAWLVLAFLLAVPAPSASQAVDGAGTRAAGMSGAFVAVVDDASAVYWNPGALATGAYFSLVLDRAEGKTGAAGPSASSRSGFLIALAAPALGLSYYRLRSTNLTPPDLATAGTELGRNVIGPGEVRLDTLVTHHVGATVVQSLTDAIAVGATLKLVRGMAAGGIVADANRDVLLADGIDLRGRSTTAFDADVGILVTSGPIRAGVTVRNLTEPEFESDEPGHLLRLDRQARAGLALRPSSNWIVAADLDLLKSPGPFGDARDVAVGTEGRVSRRAFVRAGVRVNMLGDSPLGRAPSASVGGTFAVRGSVLVDAQVTGGSKRSNRGWGIAARFVY
jgi:hypothetical protein